MIFIVDYKPLGNNDNDAVYITLSVLPPTRTDVSRLTVYYGEPGHIDSSGRKYDGKIRDF